MTDMQQTPKQAVAAEVRAAIAKAGTTPTHVAKALGLTRQAFSRRTRGITPLSVDEVILIAAFLGIEPSSLLPVIKESAPSSQIHAEAS